MRKTLELLLAGAAVALIGAGCDARNWVVGDPPPGSLNPPAGNGGPGAGGTGGGGGRAPAGGPPAMAACTEGTGTVPVRPLDGAVRPDELARRMATLFWAGAPDLHTVARAQAARTTADVAQMAAAMRADPRFADGLRVYFRKWLELDFPPRPAPAREETLLFALDVVQGGDAKLDTLLTAPYSFLNETNAGIYGLPITGPELRKVMLDPTQRGGLLTQPSFLTYNQWASSRGTLLVNALLCKNIPAAPPDLDLSNIVTPPDPSTVSSRRYIEVAVGGLPQCTACHQVIDPPGFAFENFDVDGRFRTTDHGPVDASAAIQLDGRRVAFDSFRELIPALATSCEVRRCVARQMFLHAARAVDDGVPPPIEAALPEVVAAFGAAQWDIRQLMVAVATSPPFLAP